MSAHGGDTDSAAESDLRLSHLGWAEATAIGAAQILALRPGISRSGATMTAGLLRGLSHQDAARFAFLLATPVIAAAGVLKLPELAGPEGHSVLGQVAAGSLAAGIAAHLSLRFLTRYFETRTLTARRRRPTQRPAGLDPPRVAHRSPAPRQRRDVP